MQINQNLPLFIHAPHPAVQLNAVNRYTAPVEPVRSGWFAGPGVIVEISQQAWDAYNRSQLLGVEAARGIGALHDMDGCQTCESRRYVDRSDDPSVSFQTPTRISPNEAASKVMAHEREHVANEQAKADREGRRIISQTISLSTAMCSECGRVFVSGGTTRTVSAEERPSQEFYGAAAPSVAAPTTAAG